MSLEICGCGGRMCFYQWDKGRKLQDREMSLGSTSQAHFTNSVTGEVLATEFYNDDGVMRCAVPDVLLQADTPLDVMVYTTNEHGEYTETHAKFQVRSRPMPPEYTYRTADEAVAEHNDTILALTGTEQSTAVDAVVELNATLATHLNAKGIEVEPSETAEVLVGMVDSIPHPADAYAEGVAEGVHTTNTDVLSVTGTAQPTAVEAVTEVNATLASILTEKGVEADASETTEALVGKATDIPSYEEGYNAGLEDGKAQGDTLSDFYGRWSDFELREITIGANNVTNGAELNAFLTEAIGSYEAIVLLDNPSVHQQFLARYIKTVDTYRYDGTKSVAVGGFGSKSYGYYVVEGTRYQYFVLKGGKQLNG